METFENIILGSSFVGAVTVLFAMFQALSV